MKTRPFLPSLTLPLPRRAGGLAPGLLASALFLAAVAPSAPAATLLPRVFVASTGNDANTGAQPTPKRTFASALTAVQAGGDIVALDTANYAGVTINKSVTITVVPGAIAFVLAGGNANGINVVAGSTDIVTLRGLVFEGGTSSPTGGNGVNATAVGALRIEGCQFSNFAYGIYFLGNVSSQLIVSGGGAHQVNAGLSVTSNASGVTVNASVTGYAVDDATSTAITCFTPVNGATAHLTATNCVLSSNAIGLDSEGSGSALFADGCTITGNQIGLNINSGAALISFGNNKLAYNVTSGAFTTTAGTQ